MSTSTPRRALAAAIVACLAAGLGLGAQPVAAQPPIDELLQVCGSSPDNPYLVTTVFTQGRPGAQDAGVLAFRNSANNSGHIQLASARAVGAAYGLSYDPGRETLYVAAYHKRGVPFGPAGPGGVYSVNLRTGAVATFATVPGAGNNTHSNAGNYFPDRTARFGAGTTSLGDLDLSEDGSELAVMNLNERKIFRYSVPDGTLLGSFAHGAAGQPWATDARPFGLAYHDGKLYHGVVRSAFSSQNPDELQAFVYESARDGSEMHEVTSSGLRYDRGSLWPGEGAAIWNPWKDPPGQLVPDRGRFPMPMLADIVFAADDSQMVLGFRDRFGDETFYTTPPNQPPPGEEIYNTPGGDIVAAWPADAGTWRMAVSPEYYTGDFGPNARGTHDETSFGGLAMLPDGDTVAMTANSPINISSAGAVWLSTSAGSDKAREQIYVFGQGDNFGKANGLGDLEVLCGPAEQQTPTPPASETATATGSPTTTITATPSNTASPTATVALTATPTDTALPSDTPTRAMTPTATDTLVPGVTPSATLPATATQATSTPIPGQPTPAKPDDDQPTDSPPTPLPPGATPQIPLRLPQTGGGARSDPLGVWLLALAAGLTALALWHQRRNRAKY
jgi:hypothetical protein